MADQPKSVPDEDEGYESCLEDADLEGSDSCMEDAASEPDTGVELKGVKLAPCIQNHLSHK